MNQIPCIYYRRAAEIMAALPQVDFMDIVKVVFEYSSKYEHADESDTESEEQEEAAPIPAERRNREYHGRRVLKKRSRKQYKEAVIDGKNYTATTLHGLMIQLGIQDRYRERPIQSPRAVGKPVTLEAEFLKGILDEYGSKLTLYSAYDFDGNFVTVSFENKAESLIGDLIERCEPSAVMTSKMEE